MVEIDPDVRVLAAVKAPTAQGALVPDAARARVGGVAAAAVRVHLHDVGVTPIPPQDTLFQVLGRERERAPATGRLAQRQAGCAVEDHGLYGVFVDVWCHADPDGRGGRGVEVGVARRSDLGGLDGTSTGQPIAEAVNQCRLTSDRALVSVRDDVEKAQAPLQLRLKRVDPRLQRADIDFGTLRLGLARDVGRRLDGDIVDRVGGAWACSACGLLCS